MRNSQKGKWVEEMSHHRRRELNSNVHSEGRRFAKLQCMIIRAFASVTIFMHDEMSCRRTTASTLRYTACRVTVQTGGLVKTDV